MCILSWVKCVMHLKRRFKGAFSLSKSSVSVLLLTGILAGCSSDFSRFTDGISKSSAPRKAVQNEPFDTYPPAPGSDNAHGKVESSTLAPPQEVAAYPAKNGGNEPQPAEAKRQNSAQMPAEAKYAADKRSKITYNVVSGDSLLGLAGRYKVSVAAIKRENGLTGDKILIGQKLIIPGGIAPAAHAAGERKTAAAKTAALVPVPAAEPAETEQKTESGAEAEAAEKNEAKQDNKIAAAEINNESSAGSKQTEMKQAWAAPAAGAAAGSVAAADDKAAAGNAAAAEAPAAAAEPAKPAENSAPMVWPAKGNIVSAYGQRTGTTTNDGIDIAVAEGTAVKAAAAGTVIYAGDGLKEFGNTILIRHEDNIVTVYGHNSKLLVNRGQQVKQGDVIAHSGSSGNASVAKLHFEVRQNSAPVNPMKYLPSAR